jgi:A/G-specific adenine glycosylase
MVSEFMLQQTPVSRVLKPWAEWMARWPEPADLAEASPADVLRAWGRLGYPRRALRLREAAAEIVSRHGGQVPGTEEELLALPGVGSYTAAAVAAFAFGRKAVVLDTNIRRVLARAAGGEALPAPSPRASERALAASLLPEGRRESVTWNIAVMELGALVCTAKSPACGSCPLAGQCAWLQAGKPADRLAGRRKTQAWQGTDRQARGTVMAALRAAGPRGIPETQALSLVSDPDQAVRAIGGLVDDSLAERHAVESEPYLRLPA